MTSLVSQTLPKFSPRARVRRYSEQARALLLRHQPALRHRGSPPSTLSSMTRRIRAFKRWMKSHGLDCSDALEIVDDGCVGGGISVRAVCDLKEGDLVATIPKSACLTIQTSSARQMIESAGLAGSLGLAVAVMYERSLGPASPWHGYLQLLPDRECVPLVWSLQEVDAFLSGTELHKTVKEDKSSVYEDWREFIEPLVLSGTWNIDPDRFGVEQYFSAKTLVSSRSFQIDSCYGFGMVPLADLFNHKTGAEHVHFTSVTSSSSSDDDGDSDISYESHDGESSIANSNSRSSGKDDTNLEMIIVKYAEAGCEVFNTYGIIGNAALLYRYGFTEPDNQYDIVNIDLALIVRWCSSAFSGRYCRARLSCWRKLNYLGSANQHCEYFEISCDGEPELELLVLLYIIFLQDEDYEKLGYTSDALVNLDEPTAIVQLVKATSNKRMKMDQETPGDIKELLVSDNVCSALSSLADLRESLYGSTSVVEDTKKIERCCEMKERKAYHSLVLQKCERLILGRLRDYASKRSSKKKQ